MSASENGPPRSAKGRHPIRIVTRRTGLTAAALRAWERRYRAVVPERTEGGQRLYSDDDLHRLGLLRRAVEGGRSIGHLAGLSTAELEELVREDAVQGGGEGAGIVEGEGEGRQGETPPRAEVLPYLREAVEAARQMDSRGLESALTRGALALTPPVLVEEVVVPLLRRIGVLWARGEFSAATEHLASVVVRRFLDWLLMTQERAEAAPTMVVGTPSGQVHEFGALLAAATAAAEGWKVVVLGADLPGRDIAAVARKKGAAAVALSALYPEDPEGLLRELLAVREGLPRDVSVIVGGPAAEEVAGALRSSGVEVLPDLGIFRERVRSAVRRG